MSRLPAKNEATRKQLLIRFTAAYTGLNNGTVSLYYERLAYYLHQLCAWSGPVPITDQIARDRKLYERYLITPDDDLDEGKFFSFLQEAAGIKPEESKLIEWADEVFTAFSDRVDPKTLIANQEAGIGLPLEPGFSALGTYLGSIEGDGGTIEIRNASTEVLDQYSLIIAGNGEYGFPDDPERAIRLTEDCIQDFGELLEEVCGSRTQRNRIEEACNVGPETRPLPFASTKGRRKIRKRRSGYGPLICGVQAESNALVELRGGRYAPWLVIEETGKVRAIDQINYISTDPIDATEGNNIAIARLSLFQLIELFECLEPYMGRRVPHRERLRGQFVRAEATRLMNTHHSVALHEPPMLADQSDAVS